MFTQQAASLAEGRMGANPVDFIDQLMPEIARQDAVAETAQQPLAGSLSKKDTSVSVDRNDNELREDRAQRVRPTSSRWRQPSPPPIRA
ncbi:hypothetical protein [Bosea sp. Tri-44]|uniref:hypothetical protein n=1 Tax=Bosea sp. Tri-44 TaxID=1972137 RepID=UPI00100E211C|nr:hypothetical protein [Bosea sp. Tri-44]